MRYKKLVTHVESHASDVSLFESGEQCNIKALNNNKTDWAFRPAGAAVLANYQSLGALGAVGKASDALIIHACHAHTITNNHHFTLSATLQQSEGNECTVGCNPNQPGDSPHRVLLWPWNNPTVTGEVQTVQVQEVLQSPSKVQHWWLLQPSTQLQPHVKSDAARQTDKRLTNLQPNVNLTQLERQTSD